MDRLDRQNSINSSIGTCIAVIGAILLPAGVVGTFFSVTKILARRHWWIYLIIMVVWWASLITVWLVGVCFKKWRLLFWLPEPTRTNEDPA